MYQIPSKAGHVCSQRKESAEACLKFDTRPSTPDEVRKYRKSYFSEPGVRVCHSGLISDYKSLDPYKQFGQLTKKDLIKQQSENQERIKHGNMIGIGSVISESSQRKLDHQESVYKTKKREPLGKSYIRGHQLPNTCLSKEFAFGCSVRESESAKNLIYPHNTDDISEKEKLYRKSHGAIDPGEQKKRDYNWKSASIDPTNHRFGINPQNQRVKLNKRGELEEDTSMASVKECISPEVEDPLSYHTVSSTVGSGYKSTVASKQVEDMKDLHPQLGQVRHLGHDTSPNVSKDHVFGVGGAVDEWGARDCLQGSYSIEEQQPDPDLGKAAHFGWKNRSGIEHEARTDKRIYGVPSIRTDIDAPPMNSRSVADPQNYGDDASAQSLLRPDAFSSCGISDEEFTEPRSKEEIKGIFEDAGYELPPHIFTILYNEAYSKSRQGVSIEIFRSSLNGYLDAVDDGPSSIRKWEHERDQYVS